MKQLFRLCAGVVLTLILVVPAFAGHIPCPGITDPPPDPQGRAGEMECDKLSVELTQVVYAALKGAWMGF